MYEISRNLSVSELKVKLNEILVSLQKLSQFEHSTNELQKLRSELLVLLDKKDLQLVVCSIISEILRLYAPNNPYTAKETIKIFKCFLKQITRDNISSFYLVESISNVKSIVLLCDLDNDQLIIEYFKDLLGMVHPEMSPNYQVLIRDILHQLGEEMNTIPSQVMDLIITHFSKKVEKANPAKFKLISDLCALLDDKLQRYVCQYFTDHIIEATREDEHESSTELENLHQLMLQIFAHVPRLLLNVVPQLEEELKVENVKIREIACTTLAEMYSRRGMQWIESYPSVWKEWTDRRNDKNLIIRSIFANSFSTILINHPDCIQLIEPMIVLKFFDPDEKIRTQIIQGVLRVVREHCDLFNLHTLQELAARCADKKIGPRKAAIKLLSEQFNIIMTYGGNVNMEKYSWIPGTILSTRYLNDTETNFVMEACLEDYIVPANLDLGEKVNRILQLLSNLDSKEHDALINYFSAQKTSQSYWGQFLNQCILYNGGTMDNNATQIEATLGKIIEFLAARTPDPKKAEMQLRKFADLNDGRCFKLMKTVMDPNSDQTTIFKCKGEILNRLKKQTAMYETLLPFVRRISLSIINRDVIHHMLYTAAKGKSSSVNELEKIAASISDKFIREIAKLIPGLFEAQVDNFVKAIVEGNESNSLGQLSKFAKAYPEKCPQSSELFDRLEKIAFEGTAEDAKHAMVILCKCQEDERIQNIYNITVNELSTEITSLERQLSVLKPISLYHTVIFGQRDNEIVEFIMKNLLLKSKSRDIEGSEWLDYEELEGETRAKILAIKVMRNPLLSNIVDRDFPKSFLNLLRTILNNDGELAKSSPPATRTWLRLTAGLTMLKISISSACKAMFEPRDYFKIGLLVQDTVYQVRERIIQELGTLCNSLPTKFVILFPLAAHEPEEELLQKSKSFMSAAVSTKRDKISYYFLDFLHLLAHHPDFTLDKEDVALFDPYIKFCIEILANSESVSFLYSQAGELKTVKDKLAEDSIPLYVISELAQMRIRELSVAKNWALQSYPAKIKLPKELFAPIDEESRAEVLKTVYLETKTDYLHSLETKKAHLKKQRITKRSIDDDLEIESGNENISNENLATNSSPRKISPVRRSTRQRTTTN